MKNQTRKFYAALMAGVLSITVLGGCTSEKQPVSTEKTSSSGQSAASDMPDVSQEAPEEEETRQTGASGVSLGEFTTQDINGETYTKELFEEYDLTLVNVFATWCSPCVAEMPDLEELHKTAADRGVNVVGVILDVLNEKGEIVQEDLERAQELVEKTGVTYPVLLPDPTYFNGRLIGIDGLPETFFVDKNGNIVGEVYSGSRSYEDWMEIVENELANLKAGE